MAVLVCSAALSGCAGSQPDTPALAASATAVATPTPSAVPAPSATAEAAPSLAEIQAALAGAAKVKSRSATIKLRTLADGNLALRMTGRVNIAGSTGGRVQLTSTSLGNQKAGTVDEILTPQAVYVRGRTSSGRVTGGWRRVPASVMGVDSGVPKATRYAQLLLKAGSSAVKQQQTINGAPATRLSGRIEADQIKKMEPSQYDRLRGIGVDEFSCDIWVDRKGRVVRLDQWFEYKGSTVHNILTLTKFQGKITVRPPV